MKTIEEIRRYSLYKPNQPDSDLGYLDCDEEGEYCLYDDAIIEINKLKSLLEKEREKLNFVYTILRQGNGAEAVRYIEKLNSEA